LPRKLTALVEKVRERRQDPGFRPGKVPTSLIRKQSPVTSGRQVLENLIPKIFAEAVRGRGPAPRQPPDVSDVHFHDGEPLRFKPSSKSLSAPSS